MMMGSATAKRYINTISKYMGSNMYFLDLSNPMPDMMTEVFYRRPLLKFPATKRWQRNHYK
jgi:hypothetical protein